MRKAIRSGLSVMLAASLMMIAAFAVAVTAAVPESISVFSDEADERIGEYGILSYDGGDTAKVSLLGLTLGTVRVDVFERQELIPGGMPFGVKFFTEGLVAVGISAVNTASGAKSPASEAGIKKGDIITHVNGTKVSSSEEFIKAVSENGAKSLELTVVRGADTLSLSVSPVLSSEDGAYRIGLWVRDSTAGLGTVTYIDPETGAFGGLGHGVNDSDTGILMPLGNAAVVDVEVYDVVKGRANAPGELRGRFSAVRKGMLVANTEHGVFGMLTGGYDPSEAMPIALADQVHTGKAYIRTTVDSSKGPQIYEIDITAVRPDDEEGKNFSIKVTDKELLGISGGIVQGMSGSPIIQDGKLIGAVTHVLVSDPERGYGIAIENMLAQTYSPSFSENLSAA